MPAAPDAPGRSRVRMLSVGLCGSDLHWFGEGAIGDAALERPLVLGHEMCGVAVDGPHTGRTVAIDPAIPCRRCRTCGRGAEHLCADLAFAGHSATDGGLQEELVWPDHLLHPLPDGFDGATGALLEPLGVAVHALDLSHVRVGEPVGVVGCGPIGLLVVQLLAGLGGDVRALEPLAHRRAAALRAGARVAHDSAAGDGAAAGEPDACPVVFEVSGTDDGLAEAARLAAPGGRIVLVGIPDGDRTTFRASALRRKGLTLASVRRMTSQAYLRGIALATRGAVDLSWLTTHRFPLSDTEPAFRTALARQGLKVVVDVAG